MFKIYKNLPNKQLLGVLSASKYHYVRTFLSEAYYCNEVWENRLKSPLLQKVVAEDLYHDLEQRFQKNRQLSAIDVDIFVNSVSEATFLDELLDLVHKLRLTADTGNTLNSTSHAVVRALFKFGKHGDLLNVLDDRLNYGLFIDYYTANILMDTFWKSKQYANGARTCSLLMLQEELEHPLSCAFGLLHCFKYLSKPEGWPEPVVPEEPEEEIKIRVKYLRNPYDDEHFDLKDPNKIIGKTLIMISKNRKDQLHQSFHVLGLALLDKTEDAVKLCATLSSPLYKEILDLIPENHELRNTTEKVNTESNNVSELLVENVKKIFQQTSEKDISAQCDVFGKWEQERIDAFEEQRRRLTTAKRLENIENLKEATRKKEERLWYFENEQQIDLEIGKKKVFYPKRWFGHKKKPKKIDEGYVPPEIQTKDLDGSRLA